jgi:hypothetical protein
MSWTAVTTNPAIGNGTLEGYWKAAGRTMFVKTRMIAGSTTTFGNGFYNFSLPLSSTRVSSSVAMESAAGNILNSGTRYALASFIRTSDIRGVYGNVILGHTTVVWASGDVINLSGWYEF